jgi:hypothetical protein
MALVLVSFCAYTIIEQAICFQTFVACFYNAWCIVLGFYVKLVLVVAIDRRGYARMVRNQRLESLGEQLEASVT